MTLKLHPLLNNPNSVVVSIKPVTLKLSPKDYQDAAQQVMEAMQISLEGEKVAIKPNLTSGEHFADPDTGITTHPDFVGGMVTYLYKHGAKKGGIYVVEDPRDSDDFTVRHWRGTGFNEMAEATGAKIRTPIRNFCVRKKVPRPMVHTERLVTRYAADPHTLLMNVPKMKTHNLGITSLCFKNLMGLDEVFERHYCGQAMGDFLKAKGIKDVPQTPWMDKELHEGWEAELAKRLIDLAQVIPPHLNLVEGVIARDGTGFNRGTNFPIGTVVAGINMVAVDSVASYIMGFDPLKLVYTRMAAEWGLGTNDLEKMNIYIVSEGELVPVKDVEKLRAKRKFQVISGLLNEPEYTLNDGDL
jgi:uncharacterized protein (DUF362 family)